MGMSLGSVEPPPHSLGETIARLKSRWGWFLAFGLLCMTFGALALTLVATSTLAMVFFIAIMLILAGAAEIVLGLNSRDWPTFFLWVVSGLFYLVSGAFALAQPEIAASVLTIFAGIGFLLAGIARFWLGFRLPAGPKAYILLAGVITTLLGLMILLGWPGDSLIILGTLFGVDLVFYGAGWFALGLRLRVG